MKRLLFVFLLFMSCVCSAQVSFRIDSTAYYRAKYQQSVDSIRKLNKRTVMTADQFLRLYKYDRLLKYYKICKHKPTQWKYYKGWSIRVFEQ